MLFDIEKLVEFMSIGTLMAYTIGKNHFIYTSHLLSVDHHSFKSNVKYPRQLLFCAIVLRLIVMPFH